MLDIRYIRDNKEKYKKAIDNKNLSFDIDSFLLIDEKRRIYKKKVDDLRQKRNKISESIQNGQRDSSIMDSAKSIKIDLAETEKEYNELQSEFSRLEWFVPNIPSDDTPIGASDKENIVVREEGSIPSFSFKVKDHIELATNLDIIDFERGAKVSGFRGYFLKNEGALLHLGLLYYAIETLRQKGFTFFIPPTLVKDSAMYGTGMFPFDMDNVYSASPAGKLKLHEEAQEGTNLAGTSEVPLCGYYSGEVLKEEELPKTFCGFSQCFRSEIGSYGKDTKGIYRIHEFAKVEQVVLCKNDPDEGLLWHEKLVSISEEILKGLQLPYRILQICTGDMGAGKYRMFDIETWMSARNAYGETHSASFLTDWQARRLNIRYTTKDGDKRYVYTLNNTAIASPRILIPILENNQMEDGSVKVPEVLQKWVGKEVLKPKK